MTKPLHFRTPAMLLLLIGGAVLIPFIWAISPPVRADAPAADKRKAITVGELTVDPAHVIAVYRPPDRPVVVVFLGRPAQPIQIIVIEDAREGTALFNDLWNNREAVKDPGEEDARPLTRMMPRGAAEEGREGREPRSAVLIANVGRILGVMRDNNRRTVKVYFDRPADSDPVTSGDRNGAHDSLEIPTFRDGEPVLAAYKASVLQR